MAAAAARSIIQSSLEEPTKLVESLGRLGVSYHAAPTDAIADGDGIAANKLSTERKPKRLSHHLTFAPWILGKHGPGATSRNPDSAVKLQDETYRAGAELNAILDPKDNWSPTPEIGTRRGSGSTPKR
jgi:hypothetical protein